MRSRARRREESAGTGAPWRGGGASWRERLARLDVYTKLNDDVRVKTSSGATLTLLAAALMAFLFAQELRAFATDERTERIGVDPGSLGQSMRVHFNLTFPALHCGAVRICSMDVAGDQQLDIHHGIYKARLDGAGERMTARYAERLDAELANATAAAAAALPPGYCGRCYGARKQRKDPTTGAVAGPPCCNSCAAVRAAYAARGWSTGGLHAKAEQCAREAGSAHAQPGEGCNVAGFMTVNKVAGNFHVAVGPGLDRHHRHFHQFEPAEALAFNGSHVVHGLSFGEPFPGRVNPLAGARRTLVDPAGSRVYQYFLKLVPTVHTVERRALALPRPPGFGWLLRALGGGGGGAAGKEEKAAAAAAATTTKASSFQYSFNARETPVHADFAGNVHALPGVYFVWELSPFMVQISQKPRPLGHFLARLCAVVGGAFSLSGIADRLAHKWSAQSA